MSFSSSKAIKPVFPIFNMMMNMQRMGMQAMAAYQPLASAFLDPAGAAGRDTRFGATTRGRHQSEYTETNSLNDEQVIGVGEEILSVGTRMVPGKTTRIRRVVVESPVQQDVTLHTETVILERRKPMLTSGTDVLTEVTIEMSDSNEVPVVSKSVRLVEEVLLRKEVTARTETIRDTLKRDTLEIEQPSNLPVVFQTATKSKEDEKKHEQSEPVQAFDSSPAGNKAGAQKRS